MIGAAGKPMSAAAARAAWVEERFFKYRGCAPHPDNPRVLAARPDLPVDTHFPADRDGAEPQADRVAREEAAVELCLGCPVMVACDRYANSVTPEGRLAQPDGVWGGRLARERRAAFARVQHQVASAAPDEQVQTDQKRDVLLALAMCPDGDAGAVAAAAGVPVRTANWQRSRLVTQFNLSKTSATRGELLAVAVRRGLLDASLVVADDGSVPAWSPASGPSEPRTQARPQPVSMPSPAQPDVLPVPMPSPLLPSPSPSPVSMPSPEAGSRVRVSAPHRGRFAGIDGQLSLWDPDQPEALADVHPLFPAERLEAAA